MYIQDHDETYPMWQSWDNNGYVCWGSCSPGSIWTQWTFDCAPYIKTSQIFADPLYGSTFSDAFDQTIFTDYGYNFTTLSPWEGAFVAPFIFAGVTDAAINSSASTVMISGRCDSKEMGAWWYGPGTMLSTGDAEAPDCSDSPSWCCTDWAPDGNYVAQGLTSIPGGHFTGGVADRKQGNPNFAFVDGHCKFMQPGQGAVGTNWHQGSLSGTIHVTDANLYMWQMTK
jgi:prepilin-type processing-associated H-X9-DG protein